MHNRREGWSSLFERKDSIPSLHVTVYKDLQNMTAWQRSNITVRTEKGIGPVSLKRLLLAGGIAGIVAMISGRIIGFFPSCLSAGVVLALVLVISHPVEGLPLFAFSLRTLKG